MLPDTETSTSTKNTRKNIFLESAAAVHADIDPMLLEQIGKGLSGNLRTLIGVEDLGCSITPMASSTASRQESVSRELDTLQDKTLRLCQYTTVNKIHGPANRDVPDTYRLDLIRTLNAKTSE